MNKENNMWTAPNILTTLRILLIPVFLAMILQHKSAHALAVFLLAGATDLLDGLTARLWKQKTKLGALLDPAADKLLLTAGFIVLTVPSLSSPNVIPLWLTSVVVGRDIIIVLSVFFLFRKTSQRVFYPSLLGKISTFCQVCVVLLVLFLNFLETSPPLLGTAYTLTLIVTVLSGVHYASVGLSLLSAEKSKAS
ncbi:MAG: CDP-alcohol phosphatidyltransferase family protein [Candidatus Aminicenantales bacterium]